jgi:hypothetical protein
MSQPYWQEITSVGSVEGSFVEGLFGANSGMAAYLDTMLRYRPDLSTAYGIFALQSGFTIFRLDAFALRYLDKSTWDSTADLQQFVADIYCASNNRNSTLDFLPQGRGLWKMRLEQKTFYMYPFYVGHLPGRGTWVAAGYQDNSHVTRPSQPPLIFKLSWANIDKNQLEGELYDIAHRDAWIPGLARPLLWSNPGIQIHQESKLGQIDVLGRHCVVLESLGSPLSRCDTVLDILKSMYDLLEGKDHL